MESLVTLKFIIKPFHQSLSMPLQKEQHITRSMLHRIRALQETDRLLEWAIMTLTGRK